MAPATTTQESIMNQLPAHSHSPIVIDEYVKDCIIDALREYGEMHFASAAALESIMIHDMHSEGDLINPDLNADEIDAIIRVLDHYGIADPINSFKAIVSEMRA
jgi:hypothetical protein